MRVALRQYLETGGMDMPSLGVVSGMSQGITEQRAKKLLEQGRQLQIDSDNRRRALERIEDFKNAKELEDRRRQQEIDMQNMKNEQQVALQNLKFKQEDKVNDKKSRQDEDRLRSSQNQERAVFNARARNDINSANAQLIRESYITNLRAYNQEQAQRSQLAAEQGFAQRSEKRRFQHDSDMQDKRDASAIALQYTKNLSNEELVDKKYDYDKRLLDLRNGYTEKINNLQDANKLLETYKLNATADLDRNANEMRAMQGTIDSNKALTTTLNGRLRNLYERNNAFKTENVTLTRRANKAETSRIGLQSRHDELKKQNEELETQNDTLHKELNTYQERFGNFNSLWDSETDDYGL